MESAQYINFSPANYAKLFTHKSATVRLGKRSHQLGETLLTCRDRELSQTGRIIAIQHLTVGELTNAHARADGFPSLEELVVELERCYQVALSRTDTVTVFYLTPSRGVVTNDFNP